MPADVAVAPGVPPAASSPRAVGRALDAFGAVLAGQTAPARLESGALTTGVAAPSLQASYRALQSIMADRHAFAMQIDGMEDKPLDKVSPQMSPA